VSTHILPVELAVLEIIGSSTISSSGRISAIATSSAVSSRSVVSVTATPLVAISAVAVSGALVLAVAWIVVRHGDRLERTGSEIGSSANLVTIYARMENIETDDCCTKRRAKLYSLIGLLIEVRSQLIEVRSRCNFRTWAPGSTLGASVQDCHGVGWSESLSRPNECVHSMRRSRMILIRYS
jgi:hypothetical protein